MAQPQGFKTRTMILIALLALVPAALIAWLLSAPRAKPPAPIADAAPAPAPVDASVGDAQVVDAATKLVEPLVPCPDKKSLTVHVRRAINPDAPETTEALGCAPGRFPSPGWAVVARADDQIHQILLDPKSDTVIAGAEARPDVGGEMERVETADFDGDGVDELLDEFYTNRHGIAQRTLFVLHRKDAKLDEALSLTTLSDNADAVEEGERRDEYTATARVGDAGPDGKRPLVVDGVLKRGEAAPDWIVGHAELVWKDGELAKKEMPDAR